MNSVSAYILLTHGGPSRSEQAAAIRRLLGANTGCVLYVDDLCRRRGREIDRAAIRLPARSRMIGRLAPGDLVFVASPGRLGIGREDIIDALRALGDKGAEVIDAGTGAQFRWTDQTAAAVAFMRHSALEHRAVVMRTARAAKARAELSGSPRRKSMAIDEAEAERIWRDTAFYSRSSAAHYCGVSWRTLYNRFGARTAPHGFRPKTPAALVAGRPISKERIR